MSIYFSKFSAKPILKGEVFRELKLFRLVNSYRVSRDSSAFKTQASIYQTTRRIHPKNMDLHQHQCETSYLTQQAYQLSIRIWSAVLKKLFDGYAGQREVAILTGAFLELSITGVPTIITSRNKFYLIETKRQWLLSNESAFPSISSLFVCRV
jgi:hypothetical protein